MVKPTSLSILREVPPGYLAHYVIDASVALKWILDEDHAETARRYAQGAAEGRLRLSVPSLFWYEVANALRYTQARENQLRLLAEAWSVLRDVPIHTIEFSPEAFPLVAGLASRYDITVYDSAYVFLAQSLQVPLITADERLVQRCAGLPFVWLLGSFPNE